MTTARPHRVLFGLLLIGFAAPGCRAATNPPASTNNTVITGGRLVATYRSEPQTFNRFVSANAAEELLTRLTQATLLRVNRVTHEVEPRLATEWTSSPDHLTWTLKLREGVRFSDGVPFTSADVVFTFQALYDKRVGSDIAESMMIGGHPVGVRALDDRTIELKLPAPYGPGLTLLDSIPIYPRHKLQAALDAGAFRDAWNTKTPLSDIVGLGPFVLREYVPEQRIVLGRHPYSWLRDSNGVTLPYVDEIELQIVPQQNTEVVRFEAGDVDLMTDQVRAEDIGAMRQMVSQGRATLIPAGVTISPDWLVFNLVPGAAAAKSRPWLQRDELRQAISVAVDRDEMAKTVYLGTAVPVFGPITPGHGVWYSAARPKPSRDLARAKTLLASIGLTDRNGDSMLEDAAGRPARFTVMTQQGHAIRERMATMLKQQLKDVGLDVDIVPLDVRSLFDRWSKNNYDALYFYIQFDDPDPSRNQEFWLSSGQFHFWNPRQKTPATPWEAEVDALMGQVTASMDAAERQRLFGKVLDITAEHQPSLYFVAPDVTVATSARVRGATPSSLPPQVLWNAERLWLASR